MVNLSDRTPTDPYGSPDFTFSPIDGDPLTVQRDDGALFAVRPEAAEVIETLRGRGVLVGVISYNHEGPVRNILAAFGLLPSIDYIVAEWHSNKDMMLRRMLAEIKQEDYSVKPGDALLVDDDPEQIYRGQLARMGAQFRRFGEDITDLREVLSL